MRVERVSTAAAAVLLCLLVATPLFAGSAVLAQDAPRRTYIVSLDVPDAGEPIRTTRRVGRQRARERAAETKRAIARVTSRHGIKPRHRYSAALSGFSARLTPGQAAALRADGQVSSVRPARRVRAASQLVPAGITRVHAAPGEGPAPNVDVDVAIVDTGIGPTGVELDIRGGVDCVEGPGDPVDSYADLDRDANHGTHVAGIVAARDNDLGIVGVAPGARLWAVRVLDRFGFGDEAGLVCGIDWAVQTRLSGKPADEVVDVINMSLEAPREPFDESCGPSDPDPIHVAVCAAVAAGISVVAAAGNVGYSADRRASSVVPAAYDNVITVAAISDYDGKGGGLAKATCGSGGPDDRFAWYSNYGPDVDIVAPGSCVRSTAASSSGAATRVLSGTSMAAPHVAGAVARYLAAHPGTSPERMRRLVRAAGRLDWFAASDPRWSGPSDGDAPGRIVDVAALEASQDGVRVWLSGSRLRVGRDDTVRRVRVDLQRLGGWEGVAQLSVDGLPPEVGSASFDRPGAALDGLDRLGSRLTLRLPLDAAQGPRDLEVRAEAPDGSPASGRPLALLVDRSGPRAWGLAAHLRGGVGLSGPGGSAQVTMRWSVEDRYSAVRSAVLQRRTGRQVWRAIDSRLTSARVVLKPGQVDRFRVRSRDALGNARTSAIVEARLVLRDSTSQRWQLPGEDWLRSRDPAAQGDSLLVASGPTASLATTFSGSTFALVAPVGPARGRLRVRVDGGAWQSVSLRHPRAQPRRVVFSRFVRRGTHALEIQGRAGRVAVDALLFVR